MDPVEQAFIQAMVAMSIADGSLAETEAERIAAIYRRVTTRTIDAAGVRAAADAMREARADGDSTVEAELTALRPKIPEELRPLVLQAAYLVAAADQRMDPAERALLDRIAVALAMDSEAVDAALGALPRPKAS